MDGIKAQKLHDEIIAKVAEYYELVHAPMQNPPFEPGKSKVNYAGRVFDSNEMTNLADAALEFWLTSGRYTREFEKKLAKVLGVKFALLVNSGSSANLLAFSALRKSNKLIISEAEFCKSFGSFSSSHSCL